MAKHEIHSCDVCGNDASPMASISFTCGRSFDGVETTSDWKTKDICVGCLLDVIGGVLMDTPDEKREERLLPKTLSRRDLRIELRKNRIGK